MNINFSLEAKNREQKLDSQLIWKLIIQFNSTYDDKDQISLIFHVRVSLGKRTEFGHPKEN